MNNQFLAAGARLSICMQIQIKPFPLVAECPLFSKADIQTRQNPQNLRSAFGQKLTYSVSTIPNCTPPKIEHKISKV